MMPARLWVGGEIRRQSATGWKYGRSGLILPAANAASGRPPSRRPAKGRIAATWLGVNGTLAG